MTKNDPYARVSTRVTPQSEPIAGTVPNSAGGYAFPVDDWSRLRRFLILGSEGGTYYTNERELTKQNADTLLRCIKADGQRVVNEIVEISEAGRNPKQQPVIFALAACAGGEDRETRSLALAVLPRVCRIGTHLFLFMRYVEQFRGWGRGLRRAVGKWYTDRDADDLAFQIAKYQQREGWSHRDVLRLCKPKPARGSVTDNVLAWTVGKSTDGMILPQILLDAASLRSLSQPMVAEMIGQRRLPWEVVPSEHLADARTWQALAGHMPLGALVRNLGRMTANGAIVPLSATERAVVQKLTDPEIVRRSRIHPLNVLTAASTYAAGQGFRGSMSWTPSTQIIAALDDTFRSAFGNVEASDKRILIGLDVSGSMDGSKIAGTFLTARAAASAMAIVTLATEQRVQVVAFQRELVPLALTGTTPISQAVAMTHNLPFGPTDCAAPMLYAIEHGLEVDTFIIYTDSETWAGRMHPVQALQRYRELTGIAARLIVVGMCSNGFSIADPNDAGMLDVVGFDSAAPGLIADFAAGRV